jgi:hypothetical protein
MKNYFTKLYFDDVDLDQDIRFSLANRMYQFFKFFGTEDAFKNPAVCEFYLKMSLFPESKIVKQYNSSNKAMEPSSGIIDPKFFDNYLCVAFFESITRMVFVSKQGNDKPVRVIFTLNPMAPLLSKNTKEDFVENVGRSDRYIKLVSLMENCEFFIEEVTYKKSQGKDSSIIRVINDLNFYRIEVCGFLITVIINIILLKSIKGEGKRLYGDPKVDIGIKILGLINLIFNFLATILWLYTKFGVYYLAEMQRILKKKKNDMDEEDNEGEEEEEIDLSIWEKLYATYIVLFGKGKLFGFIWNMAFSLAGFLTENYFFYICQIYGVVNLSQTLRNLVLSFKLKINQIVSILALMFILNLIFGCIAFFKFSRDFIREVPSRTPHHYPNEFRFLNDIIGGVFVEPAAVESECATLLFCFATHVDYGMRFDGGIADRMEPTSFTHYPGYYLARFFYEEGYFISLVILVLNMLYGIVIEAFSELRSKEEFIERDKKEICFICGIDKETCEKKGEKLDEHMEKVHNIWTYVEYMLGLRFVDIQETNAINSYVIESLEKKEIAWFPYDEAAD